MNWGSYSGNHGKRIFLLHGFVAITAKETEVTQTGAR